MEHPSRNRFDDSTALLGLLGFLSLLAFQQHQPSMLFFVSFFAFFAHFRRHDQRWVHALWFGPIGLALGLLGVFGILPV